MRNKRPMILAGLCVLLTACSVQNGAENLRDAEDRNETTISDTAPDTETEEETSAGTENSEYGNTENESAEIENLEENDSARESFYYVIDNPGAEYYLTEKIENENDIRLSLEQLTEESNEITDEEKWFADNGLNRIVSNYMEDEKYSYRISGNDAFYGYLLDITDKASGEYAGCLSFEKYRYMEPYLEKDEDFIEQKIWWAQTVEDVLYVSVGHYTYTESCPNTGYLVAIDLNDMSVMWKSEPCVTNSRNFEIIDNTIVCGYGFTGEPDYLILVDRLDGSVQQKIPLKSMADYIIRKDDILYVRTYNTNYTFQIYRAALGNEGL